MRGYRPRPGRVPAAGIGPLVRLHYVTECDSISHGGRSPVLQYESTQAHHAMHITERTSKPEIISAALELTDHQAATIARLHQQQRILWAALAALTAWALL